MKYLKIWENWNHEYTKEQIQEWLELYLDIFNYSINDDGLIDVNESVIFDHIVRDKSSLYKLIIRTGKLPFRFGHVRGDFKAESLDLKTLEGFPRKVRGFFSCKSNKLTSLEGGPIEVGLKFICSKNLLVNLEFAPQVGCCFDCHGNQLTSLYGAPKSIHGLFDCRLNEKLETLEFCPEIIDGNLLFSMPRLKTLNFFPKKINGQPSGDWFMKYQPLRHHASLKTLIDQLKPVSLQRKFYLEKIKLDLLTTLPQHALTPKILNEIRQKYPEQYAIIKSKQKEKDQWSTDLQADAGEYGL